MILTCLVLSIMNISCLNASGSFFVLGGTDCVVSIVLVGEFVCSVQSVWLLCSVSSVGECTCSSQSVSLCVHVML